MYAVEITDLAEADILATVEYIAEVLKAPIAANHLLDELTRIENLLTTAPYIYPQVADEYLSGRGLRMAPIKNFRLFYTVDDREQKIFGIRFLYCKRNWRSILKDENPPL